MPLVLDHGSYYTKFGYSGYYTPKVIRSTVTINDTIPVVGLSQTDAKNLNINSFNPIKNGIIIDIDKMTDIWDDIIYFDLDIEPSDNSILITTPTISNEESEKQIYEIFTEKYNFKKVKQLNQDILSLYYFGKKTGLVVDLGHDYTHCVPIFDGYILKSKTKITKLAGKMITDYLQNNFYKDLDFDSVNQIKENRSYYKKKIASVDIFFNPNLIDYDSHSLDELIDNCIKSCDIDLRRALYENIVLVGGTSLIPKLPDELEFNLLSKSLNTKVISIEGRGLASWIGGSIIGCSKYY